VEAGLPAFRAVLPAVALMKVVAENRIRIYRIKGLTG
jgi:hypothetical protein